MSFTINCNFKTGIYPTGILIIILCVSCPIYLFGQFNESYLPIHKSESIPPSFIIDPIIETKKNVENNKLLSSEEAESYFSQMIFLKSQLFQNGKIYLPNEITQYLDSLTEKLLLVEPKLKTKIKVHLTRYTQSNAFCLADGSVFINIGLLAVLENEDELAFILSHEIAHFANQHSIKDLKRVSEIQKKEYNYNNQNSGAYLSLRFSRESEFDADSWALQLIAQAGYNPELAASALEKLKENQLLSPIDFHKFLDNETFKIDTSLENKTAISKAKAKYITENEENVIAAGKLGDLFQTHPDILKRIESVQLMAKDTKRIGDKKTDNVTFSRIKQLAQFERIENNYLEQDYINAVLSSFRLLEIYPDNRYLHVSVSRSLYWLGYYKEIGVDDLKIKGDQEQNTNEVFKLYALIDQMKLNEAKKMAYCYSKAKIDKYLGNENLLFYFALNTDNYLGKNAAINYYRDYRLKYPNGSFINFINAKLE